MYHISYLSGAHNHDKMYSCTSVWKYVEERERIKERKIEWESECYLYVQKLHTLQTHTITQSLSPSLTHYLIHSINHSLTHSFTLLLTTHSLSYPLIHAQAHRNICVTYPRTYTFPSFNFFAFQILNLRTFYWNKRTILWTLMCDHMIILTTSMLQTKECLKITFLAHTFTHTNMLTHTNFI